MQFILHHWPLAFICVAMIVAAVIDGWKLKVPNWLTFPLILSGWGLGILHNCGLLESTGSGGIGASLIATALGFILLFPLYAIGGMGAGDVKMQMGFGAWVGAFYGMQATENHPGAGWIVVYAFCLAAVIGGVLALGMIVVRGQLKKNMANTSAILRDLLGSGVGKAANKAAQRKSRMHLLPYGIPLCLGFISYLIYLHGV
ncbi:MAG TPA: A24 family peptidase [Gemmataceae bacterium]|jgi:prepilin peptidase CpaA